MTARRLKGHELPAYLREDLDEVVLSGGWGRRRTALGYRQGAHVATASGGTVEAALTRLASGRAAAPVDPQLLLDVRGLSVSYQGAAALSDVTIACRAGQVMGLIGPNGAGKSTFLKAVLGLIDRDGGVVRVAGSPVTAVRGQVAYLPQRAALDWDYPAAVAEVVGMGCYPELGPLRRVRPSHRARVVDALARVDLLDLADRRIGELSGGQQQRVFLARALAQRAKLLLLDEPFAAVDARTEAVLWRQLRQLAEAGAAVVVVHHDLETVSERYDRLALLARRLVAEGPVETVLESSNVDAAYRGPAHAGLTVAVAR